MPRRAQPELAPNVYKHPAMGTFTKDENDDYIQTCKKGRSSVLLRLNCGYAGREHIAEHLRSCERIANRVHAEIHSFVRDAFAICTDKTAAGVNRVREIEGKRVMGKDAIRRRLRLIDVAVSPNDLTVVFSADLFDDEHNLFTVKYGPRLGFRDAYIY